MDIYGELGVRKIVNAFGTVTPYGGVLLSPEVTAAMADASRAFVDVSEFAAKAGHAIAELVGFPDGLVTAGAAAGLTVATAAALCGPDTELAAGLPDVRGRRREVLVHRCQRTHWTQAVRLAGAKIVEFGSTYATTVDELSMALTDRTAAVLYYAEHAPDESLPLGAVTRAAQVAGVPVIVDAAALVPPISEVRTYGEKGAAVTLLSGGKLIGGPASTGLALGEPAMIQAMRVHSSPRFGVGRSMKVGKEDIAGLVRAVQIVVSVPDEERLQRWTKQARRIEAGVRLPDGMSCRYVDRGEDAVLPRGIPRVYVEWSREDWDITAEDVASRLLAGNPAVAVGAWEGRIGLNPAVLLDDEIDVLVERLNGVLGELTVA